MANEKKSQTNNTANNKKWLNTYFVKPYQKVKWFLGELINIYSSKPSYFSKKRIESGIAFVIAQWGMIFFLLQKYETLTMGEFLLWASAEFAVSGYIINKIQKEKQQRIENQEEQI